MFGDIQLIRFLDSCLIQNSRYFGTLASNLCREMWQDVLGQQTKSLDII